MISRVLEATTWNVVVRQMALPAFQCDCTTQCCRTFTLALARLSCYRQLRSASSGCIQLSRVQTSVAHRSFAYSGPAVWNSLPATHTVTTHIQAATENAPICGMINTIRRCCGVFATLAPLNTRKLCYRKNDRAMRRQK